MEYFSLAQHQTTDVCLILHKADFPVATHGKQTTSNFLSWLGRPVYSIKEDLKATSFGLGASLIKMIDDGALAEDHQTIDYPEQWGQKVTDTN